MEKFSQRLRALRKEKGLTQDELGVQVHLNRSTLCGYESENKEPPYETLCLLADFFNVSTDYLLGHSQTRKNVGTVFFGDTVHFERALQGLPESTVSLLSGCVDDVYRTLIRDAQTNSTEKISLMRELFSSIRSNREIIRALAIPAASDPRSVPSLISAQEKFKSEICGTLDKALQTELESAAPLSEKQA